MPLIEEGPRQPCFCIRLVIDYRQSLARHPVTRIHLQHFGIQRPGAPRRLHRLVKFAELQVSEWLPLVEFDSLLKVFHCFAAKVAERRQAGCQGRMLLGNLRRKAHALAKPENRARYVSISAAVCGQTKTILGILLFFGVHL
jgi:hypothetical protein